MQSGRPWRTELYVALFQNVPGAVFPAPVVRAERAYKRRLVRLGHIVVAGPWSDHSGGMAILRGESEAALRQLLDNEPFILNGLQTYDLRAWHTVHGDLGLRDEIVSSRLFAG